MLADDYIAPKPCCVTAAGTAAAVAWIFAIYWLRSYAAMQTKQQERPNDGYRPKLLAAASLLATLCGLAWMLLGLAELFDLPPPNRNSVWHDRYITGTRVATAFALALLPASIALNIAATPQNRRSFDSRVIEICCWIAVLVIGVLRCWLWVAGQP